MSWHALFVRAHTPRDVAGKLHDEMKSILATPEMAAAISKLGLIPETPQPIEATREYIRSETAKWGALVKSLGLEASE